MLVQISRVMVTDVEADMRWNSIREQQRLLPGAIKHCFCVPAVDLPLDDLIHLSGAGQALLGRRLAQAMDVLVRGKRGGKAPISLKSVSVQEDPGHVSYNVIVEFENVEGRLVS